MNEDTESKEILVNSDSQNILENPADRKSRWRSIRVLYFTAFLGALGFSIVMTSVWPFLNVLDENAETSYLGFVIGAYSLGQVISSPFLGWLANRSSQTSPSLYTGMVFQILGYLVWVYLQDFGVAAKYLMLVSRIITGFGAGNLAAIRSYVSKATSLRERTAVTAMMNASLAFGFSIGPAVQAALVPLEHPGPVESPGFHLNMYTSPGWLGLLLGFLNMLLVRFCFREHSVPDAPPTPTSSVNDPENEVNVRDVPEHDSVEMSNALPYPDYPVIWAIIFLYFTAYFIFVTVETIATPLSIYQFGWSREEAVVTNGIIWAVVGILAVVAVFVVRGPAKRVLERKLLVLAFGILFISLIIYLPMAGPKPPIKWMNGTSSNSSHHDQLGGCPSNLNWCLSLPGIHISQMFISTIGMGLGFAIAALTLNAIFSKILGPIPQGLWMGVFTSLGSFARLIGPVYVGIMLEDTGPLVTLITIAGSALIGLMIVFGIYNRILSYYERRRLLLNRIRAQSYGTFVHRGV